MKVAVVGSRGLGDKFYPLVKESIPIGCSEIISGGAQGIDRLAERYAAENDMKLTVIRPDYGQFDRAAPIIRNSEIIAAADFVLIFWDGSSKGSLNVIMTCIKTNKPFKVMMAQ